MTCKTILAPTDFSPASRAALAYASALAHQWDALLLIVHVEEPVAAIMLNENLESPLYPNPETRQLLESVVPNDAQVRYEHRLALGIAAEEIPRLAEYEKVDLIVMGTHGRTGLTRLLMGSVAEAVVRRATCPVLTVKCPAPDAKKTMSPNHIAAGT